MRALSESSGPDLGRLSWVIWLTFKTLGAGGDFVHHIAAATRINTATAIAIEGHRTRSRRGGETLPTGTFPEVVSRFRRRRSARSSAALWERTARSFSSALFMIRSSSRGIFRLSRNGVGRGLFRIGIK